MSTEAIGLIAGRNEDRLFAAYKGVSRFSSLDGLRFICIFAVLWHHAPTVPFGPDTTLILQRGFLGVDFFFVLSGFLITTLLLREEERKGRFSLADFYWRRILRIVPVYFFVVSAVAAYYVLFKGQARYAELVPYYYLFLSNFLTNDIPTLAPTWSLAVEEQYYLIWPLLLLVLPRRMIPGALLAVIGVNVLGIMGAFAGLGIVPVDIGPLHIALPNATYAPILMGSGVALLLNNRVGFSWLSRALAHPASPVPAFVTLLVIIQLAPPDLRGLPNLAIHLMMSICLITLVIQDRNILTPLLSWRPIARVGEISYGIYLYHLIALHFTSVFLTRIGWDLPWPVLILYSLLSILIADISFRTLEAWFRRFRNRRPGAGRV